MILGEDSGSFIVLVIGDQPSGLLLNQYVSGGDFDKETYRFREEECKDCDNTRGDKLNPDWDPPAVVAFDVSAAIGCPASNDSSDRPHAVVETGESTSPLNCCQQSLHRLGNAAYLGVSKLADVCWGSDTAVRDTKAEEESTAHELRHGFRGCPSLLLALSAES